MISASSKYTRSISASRRCMGLHRTTYRQPSSGDRLGLMRVHAGLIEKLNQEELEVAIMNRDKILLVDFFATWCGPCVLLAQELEKVAEQLSDQVKIVKVDVDQNQALAGQLKIEGLPTLVFIPAEGGQPALRTEGLMQAQQIIDIVSELVAKSKAQA